MLRLGDRLDEHLIRDRVALSATPNVLRVPGHEQAGDVGLWTVQEDVGVDAGALAKGFDGLPLERDLLRQRIS